MISHEFTFTTYSRVALILHARTHDALPLHAPTNRQQLTHVIIQDTWTTNRIKQEFTMQPGQPPYDGSTASHVNGAGGPHLEQKPPIKRSTARITIVSLTIFLGLGALVGSFFIGRSTAPSSDSTNATASSSASPGTSSPAAIAKKPLVAEDFTVGISVLKKSCFGSAGCNVTYAVEPGYTGRASDLAGRKMRVVYEISGAEDSEVGFFNMTGTSASLRDSYTISTASSDSVLIATVTSVTETG